MVGIVISEEGWGLGWGGTIGDDPLNEKGEMVAISLCLNK